jgi:hypothetical protein
MTYLLFLLSIGLATALAVVIKKLQKRNNAYAIAQERLKEADRRLREAEHKYGGIISREDSERGLDTKISVLTDRLKQLDKQAYVEEQELSAKISILRTKLQELEELEFIESFGFYESKYDFQEAEQYKQRLDQIRDQQKQMIKSKEAAICRTEWSVGGSVKEGKK